MSRNTSDAIANECPNLIDGLKNGMEGKAQLPEKASVETERVLDEALYMGAGANLSKDAALDRFKKDPDTFVKWCATSSRGVACSDEDWQEIVGRCAVESRAKAADAARYARKQLTDGEMNSSAQSFFSDCLSNRLYGNSSKAKDINKSIKDSGLNIIAAAAAGSTAKTAKAKEILENLQSKYKETPTDGSSNESEKTCGSEMPLVGWIICPVITVASGFADSVWVLFEQLLKTNLLQDSQNGSATVVYKIWDSMRSIANALLVIVFMVVIFSQISNMGISNYGIKKILPRFFVAAVAINLSFYMAQIAVDIANTLGSTIDDLIMDQVPKIDLSKVGFGQVLLDVIGGGLTFGGVALAGAAALAVVGPSSAILFVLLAVVPGIIGIVAGLMALVFRTAAIPILAAIAPIAIAAWLLPNTQKLFDKWRSLFLGLLFLYPLAALYYGALKFFSLSILADSGSGTFQRLMALSLLFIGSFVVLIMAFKSNAIMGKMSGAIKGLSDKLTAPATKAGRNVAGSMAKEGYSRFMNQDHSIQRGKRTSGVFGRKRFTRFAGRAMQGFDKSKRDRELRTGLASNEADQAYREGILNDPSRLGDLGQTTGGQAFLGKLESEAVSNKEVHLKNEDISGLQRALHDAIKGGDRITAQAAQNRLLKSGAPGVEAFNDTIKDVESGVGLNSEMRSSLASNLRDSHPAVMDRDAGTMTWATQGGTMQDSQSKASADIEEKGISTDKFAGMTEKAQLRLLDSGRNILSQDQVTALSDPSGQYGGKIAKSVTIRLRSMDYDAK